MVLKFKLAFVEFQITESVYFMSKDLVVIWYTFFLVFLYKYWGQLDQMRVILWCF